MGRNNNNGEHVTACNDRRAFRENNDQVEKKVEEENGGECAFHRDDE